MASKSEDATSFAFKADTQKLLGIIINSLYQNKEVFIRELISNASDALNKIRIKQLTSEKIFDSDAELVIELISDKEENTLTIRDTGIGMNQKELKTNLGTIAQSGTAEFLDALESNENDLIGQFGVGFYSAFLVSKKVVVKTRSFSQNSKPWTWESEGTEDFQIYPGDKEDRGTEVILHLKDDFGEYNEDYRLKSLVKKYSNYVEFPIKLGDDTLNDQTALWRVSSSEVKDEQYNEFFNHLGSFGEPMVRIHLSADVPIEFYTILYVPRARPRNVVSGDKEWGLKLYNRKILIEEKNKDFLPEYMRFVIGVVDAEDLDLNISREVLQNTRIQKQIKNYLQKKLLDEFEKMAKDDEDAYLEFYREFGAFLKEGIAGTEKHKDRLIDLLRFNTSAKDGSDGSVSLAKYVERMKVGQEEIYYLTGLEFDMVKKSPHLEYYNREGYEVLLMGEAIDSFLMMHLTEFQEKKFFLIDQDESEVSEDESAADDSDEDEESGPKEKTGPHAVLLNKFVEILDTRVTDVKASERLVGSVARLVTPKGGISSDLQRAMKIMETSSGSGGMNIPMMGKILQINPDHEILILLSDLIVSDDSSDLISLVINQIHDNARISEGDTPDFLQMTQRIEKIIEKSLK